MRRLAITLGTMMAILCAGFLAWQAEAMVVAGATHVSTAAKLVAPVTDDEPKRVIDNPRGTMLSWTSSSAKGCTTELAELLSETIGDTVGGSAVPQLRGSARAAVSSGIMSTGVTCCEGASAPQVHENDL